MYYLSLCYIRWINFWRLPETDQTRRTQSVTYGKRVEKLRTLWLILLPLLAVVGQPPLLISGLILLVFVSFMFLDET